MALLMVGVFPIVLMAHQFYVSITSMQHHPETQKLSIRVRLFANDLEESIFQEQGVRLGFWTNSPLENAQAYVESYVSSRLFISVNDSPIRLNFISQKVESAEVIDDTVIICELEAYDVSEIATIQVRNSLLIETFDDQINIVNIRANNTKKVMNLDRKLPKDQVAFH